MYGHPLSDYGSSWAAYRRIERARMRRMVLSYAIGFASGSACACGLCGAFAGWF